jgi:hypothetical protein
VPAAVLALHGERANITGTSVFLRDIHLFWELDRNFILVIKQNLPGRKQSSKNWQGWHPDQAL